MTTVNELIGLLTEAVEDGRGDLPILLRIGAVMPQGEIERDGDIFVEFNDAFDPCIIVEG